MFLPADRVIVGGERYTLAEVAERTGVELEFLIDGPARDGPADPRARGGGLHRGRPGVGAA